MNRKKYYNVLEINVPVYIYYTINVSGNTV